MARFQGTIAEFHTYLGPRIRNLANAIARRDRKARDGRCQHCEGVGLELESAHIHGFGRRSIIQSVLKRYCSPDGLVDCDISEVQKDIVAAHLPIEDHFIFICNRCHRAYDVTDATRELRQRGEGWPDRLANAFNAGETLQISLKPPQIDTFKQQLLVCRRAILRTFYVDGQIQEKIWIADNFSEASSVMGNLRSRPEYRQGAWQRLGIHRLEVEIDIS